MFFYLHWYGYIIVLPGILFALWAQIRVSTTFAKYDKVPSRSDWTASDLSRMLLEKYNCNVLVQPTGGRLSDNYNPKTGVLSLSESTYRSNSVAALGVAAHEVGHAVQHEEGYFMLKLRSVIVPVVISRRIRSSSTRASRASRSSFAIFSFSSFFICASSCAV